MDNQKTGGCVQMFNVHLLTLLTMCAPQQHVFSAASCKLAVILTKPIYLLSNYLKAKVWQGRKRSLEKQWNSKWGFDFRICSIHGVRNLFGCHPIQTLNSSKRAVHSPFVSTSSSHHLMGQWIITAIAIVGPTGINYAWGYMPCWLMLAIAVTAMDEFHSEIRHSPPWRELVTLVPSGIFSALSQ